MNILFIKHFFVGFMVSEIPRVSVFGYFPLHNECNTRYYLIPHVIYPLAVHVY